MDTTIYIDLDLKDKIVKHAKAIYPNECCGFLFGKDNDIREIEEIRVLENAKEGDQRRRYEISAKDYIDAEKYAIDKGITLLGVYHSHPDHSALASQHDLEKAVPFFSYVITSIHNGEFDDFRSFQLDLESGNFNEERILITDKF